ncbi:MAG: 4Fe-4S binding protein [Dehalobacterium sp.]
MGINYKKLRSLGVPDEIISTLDERDGGNIDPQGNVLFLDEDRVKSREDLDHPLRKNQSNGLGIKNSIVKKSSANIHRKTTPPTQMFDLLEKGAAWDKNSIKGKIYRSFMGFDAKGYTHGTVLPLNVDMSNMVHGGVLPIDLVYAYLEDAEFIAIMHRCVCRYNYDCKDYPIDFGCIFLNAAGRIAVQDGIGRKVTVEEAKEHVQQAMKHGLFANAEFVQIEQFLWGLRNDQMNEFRMICFCDNRYCLAMRVVRNGNKEIKARFTSCGYTSVIDHDKCVGCKSCASACPQKAISYREDGKSVINQDNCMGCGFCRLECRRGAISTKQTMPLRASVNEYFLKEARIDDGLPHKK